MARRDLAETMGRCLPQDGIREALPGLRLGRTSKPSGPILSVDEPSFCFVAQGRKRTMIGDQTFHYDPFHYLIFTVDLPIVFQVEDASSEEPYLGLRLRLDPKLVASMVMEMELVPRSGDARLNAAGVHDVDYLLLDVVLRLIRLVERPEEQEVLYPLIQRELLFRLLIGGQASRLGHLLASTGGEVYRMARAISRLRQDFDQPLRIEHLAQEVGMSVSGFYHHFKSVTAMSPLQFQKQIRLQEARRLMLGEDLDAATAGGRVGYDDPSYFSREYKKQFGSPPQKDISHLRAQTSAQAR